MSQIEAYQDHEERQPITGIRDTQAAGLIRSASYQNESRYYVIEYLKEIVSVLVIYNSASFYLL